MLPCLHSSCFVCAFGSGFGSLRAASRLVARVFFCLAACFLFCVIYEIISHTHMDTPKREGYEKKKGGSRRGERGVAHTATHNDVGLSWTAARLALACLDG